MAELKPFDERLQELVAEHGNKWTDIAQTLESEGYAQSGVNLAPDALRKKYRRISTSSTRPQWPQVQEAKLTPQAEMQAASISALPKLAEVLDRLLDKMESGSPKQPLLEYDSLRMDMIKEHLLHVQERRLDKKTDDLKDDLLKDIGERIRQAVGELKLEILETLDARIAERVGEVQKRIALTLEEETDAKLCDLKEELQGNMQIALTERLEAKFQSELGQLLEGVELKEKTPGPGRGHKGSSVTKFSATIPDELYERMKSFGGMFSSHLAAACTLYIKAREKYPTTEA